MIHHIPSRWASAFVGGVLAAASPALAHPSFDIREAAPDNYYFGFLRVPHGCNGSATVEIRLEIPEPLYSVSPQPKPGWNVAVEKQALSPPRTLPSGRQISQRTRALIWTGRLEDGHVDQFGLMFRAPHVPGALYFPTVQTCEVGQRAWTGIPTAEAPQDPARDASPVILVTLKPDGNSR